MVELLTPKILRLFKTQGMTYNKKQDEIKIVMILKDKHGEPHYITEYLKAAGVFLSFKMSGDVQNWRYIDFNDVRDEYLIRDKNYKTGEITLKNLLNKLTPPKINQH